MDSITVNVGVIFDCDDIPNEVINGDNVARGEAELACRLILMLRDQLQFRISYHHYTALGSYNDPGTILHDLKNGSLDLYAGLLRASQPLLDFASPLLMTHTQRLGFSLLQSDESTLRSFYSEPFRRPAWLCVFAIFLIFTVALHYMHLVECRLGLAAPGHVCGMFYEFMVAVAAGCQIAVPICTRLNSRRIAYGSFFGFALLLHSFYTSKIVSSLLNHHSGHYTLRRLADSDLVCLLLEQEADVFGAQLDEEIEYFKSKKLVDPLLVDVRTGVDLLRRGSHALFSDYISIYPAITATFRSEETCATTELDVFPVTGKFLWAARRRRVRIYELFKNRLLVLRERGELARALHLTLPVRARAECALAAATPPLRVRFAHLTTALLGLAVLYTIALLILLAEISVFRSRHHIIRPYLN